MAREESLKNPVTELSSGRYWLGSVPEVVEEGLEVLLHLNGVVLWLCDAEDPHLAVLPGAVLHEEEGEQHEEAAVVHDPPYVDVALHLVTGVGEPLQDDKNGSGHICNFISSSCVTL